MNLVELFLKNLIILKNFFLYYNINKYITKQTFKQI